MFAQPLRHRLGVVLLVLGCFSALVEGAGSEHEYDAKEIVTAYLAATQSYPESAMSFRYEVTSNTPGGPARAELQIKQYRDGTRYAERGSSTAYDPAGTPLPNQSFREQRLVTDKTAMTVTGLANGAELEARVAARGDTRGLRQWCKTDPKTGAFLDGTVTGSNKLSVPELLSRSRDLRIVSKSETIGGVETVMVKGDTPYGTVSAWIAPGRGEHALRFRIVKDKNDLYDERRVRDKWPDMTKAIIALDDVTVKEIGGVHMPVAGTLTSTMVMDDGARTVIRERGERSDADLDPNFEHIGAFQVDLPDGTPCPPRSRTRHLVRMVRWRHCTEGG